MASSNKGHRDMQVRYFISLCLVPHPCSTTQNTAQAGSGLSTLTYTCTHMLDPAATVPALGFMLPASPMLASLGLMLHATWVPGQAGQGSACDSGELGGETSIFCVPVMCRQVLGDHIKAVLCQCRSRTLKEV